MEFLRNQRSKIKRLIVIIAIILLIVAPSISYMNRTTAPAYIVNLSPEDGSEGYNVYTTPHDPQTSVIVYNGTVNDRSADWYSRAIYFCQVHNDSRGVLLNLEGTGTTTWGATLDSTIEFLGRPTFPLMNYSEAYFSVDINVIQGSVDAKLLVNYWEWPTFDWLEAGENSTRIEEGQSGHVMLIPSLENAYDLTSGWSIRTTMILTISSSEESLVQIGDVIISVESNEELYPVTFDMQAPDGESLFLNPSMDNLRPKESYHYYSEYPRYTAIELTRTGNSTDSSIYEPRMVNEILFLAEGTYEGVAGWFYGRYKMEGSLIDISFTVGANQSLFVAIKIPTFRLYIEINPAFAYSEIYVAYIYKIEYPIKNADYLYMPIRTSFDFTISPLSYQGHSWGDDVHFSYRQSKARIHFVTNGSSSVHVSVYFRQFTVFGIIVDWGQILGIVGIALLLVFLFHGMIKNFKRLRIGSTHRIKVVTILLYYIVTILPWVTYSFETDANPSVNVSAAIIVPNLATFWWTPLSQVTPAPSSYLLTYFPEIDSPLMNQILLIIMILYWISFIFISYSIATREDFLYQIMFTRKISDSYLAMSFLVCPFVLGCFYLWFCLIGLCLPSFGLIVALLTLPSWGVSVWLKERPTANQGV